MGRVTYTEQDIKRSTILEPGWYLTEIIDVTEKESSGDRSMNFIIDFKVLSSKNAEINGVPLRRYFNEKVPNFMKSFIEVFAGKVEVGKTYEITRDLVGKKLMTNVARGEFNGQPKNEPSDFAPEGVVPAVV